MSGVTADNFSEDPAGVFVTLFSPLPTPPPPFFNGPLLLCHTGKSPPTPQKLLSFLATGMLPSCPGFLFSTVASRCLMEGSWQSIIWFACSESRRRQRGELDYDGWCGEAFSYWPEKLDPIVSYQGEKKKSAIKACQYGPSISLQKVTCASPALSPRRSVCRLIHLLQFKLCPLKWRRSLNDWQYRRKDKVRVAFHDEGPVGTQS